MLVSKMTIARFAAAAGVGVETVRFYQRQGLLPIPVKRQSACREYDLQNLEQLRFIRRAQQAGFTLKEIKELIHLNPSADRTRIQAITRERLKQLTVQINDLQNIAKVLNELLSDCEQGSHAAPCPIIAALGNEFNENPGY